MKTSIACFSLLLASGVAQALVPDGPEFGLIGGGQGQIARLNAVCSQDSTSLCYVSAFYADMLGRPVTPVKVFNLMPGTAGSLDFNFSSLVSQAGGRAEVRPVVKLSFSEKPTACLYSA